jgi:hypothetical protein
MVTESRTGQIMRDMKDSTRMARNMAREFSILQMGPVIKENSMIMILKGLVPTIGQINESTPVTFLLISSG